VPLSAADRAARELEEFTMRNHADVDPNAPPAMKASPSVSGDDAGELLPDVNPCLEHVLPGSRNGQLRDIKGVCRQDVAHCMAPYWWMPLHDTEDIVLCLACRT